MLNSKSLKAQTIPNKNKIKRKRNTLQVNIAHPRSFRPPSRYRTNYPNTQTIERANQIHHLKQTRYQQTSDAAPIRIVETQHTEQEEQNN
jgi:hypothetical protein